MQQSIKVVKSPGDRNAQVTHKLNNKTKNCYQMKD